MIRNYEQYLFESLSYDTSSTLFLAMERYQAIQHFHLLIWIKNAPILDELCIEKMSKFILK